MNLPTWLTVGRLILCVVFTAVLQTEEKWSGTIALSIFIIASLTDWLDGYLARKLRQTSDLGKLLDPLADKILISSAFICFVGAGLAPAWIVVCIISREFLITGLRTLAAAKGVILAAEKMGKHKTISQMLTAIFALIMIMIEDLDLGGTLNMALLNKAVLHPLLYFTLIITIFSGVSYYLKNQKLLFGAFPLDEIEKG